MACLDTTFLVDWLRGNQNALTMYDKLRNNGAEDEIPAVSIISVYQLEKGAKISKNPARDLKLVRDLLSELEILNFDRKCVDISSDLFSRLRKKGKTIGEFDVLIAATCLAAGESLVTNDEDYDRIDELVKVHY